MTQQQLTLPGEVVKKSNEFIRASLSLEDVNAARLFATVIACINPDDADFQDYKVSTNDLILERSKGGTAYQRIKKALRHLAASQVELRRGPEPESDYTLYPLIAKAEYRRGVVHVQIHPDLKPHFIGLAAHFTSYNLIEFRLLSSQYSQRLFEVLISYKSLSEATIPLEKLHHMVNTPASLRRDFAQFRRWVLDQAGKDIHRHTSLNYEWEAVKQGRAVTAIRFIFTNGNKVIEESNAASGKEDERERRNQTIVAALECAAEKTSPCSGNEDTPEVCRLCRAFEILKMQ